MKLHDTFSVTSRVLRVPVLTDRSWRHTPTSHQHQASVPRWSSSWLWHCYNTQSVCSSLKGLLCVRWRDRLLPGSVVPRRCPPAACEYTITHTHTHASKQQQQQHMLMFCLKLNSTTWTEELVSGAFLFPREPSDMRRCSLDAAVRLRTVVNHSITRWTLSWDLKENKWDIKNIAGMNSLQRRVMRRSRWSERGGVEGERGLKEERERRRGEEVKHNTASRPLEV